MNDVRTSDRFCHSRVVDTESYIDGRYPQPPNVSKCLSVQKLYVNVTHQQAYAVICKLDPLIAVASLGLVSPGAATDGCHPYLFLEKTDDLFSHNHLSFCRVAPTFYSNNWRPFLLITVNFIDFTRVSPPAGCHPGLFLPVRPRFSTVLSKFSPQIFFSFGCHPLEGVTWGGPPNYSVVFSWLFTVINWINVSKSVHIG